MAHPTNIAISEDGNTMYTANLGRWHITEIDISGFVYLNRCTFVQSVNV